MNNMQFSSPTAPLLKRLSLTLLLRRLGLTMLTACLFPLMGNAQSAETADPNFYIYLCFGQSNMEGNAQPESVDKGNVDTRFRMLATTKFTSPVRVMGRWYTANPPIVSPQGGLGMADYFGRTMVAAMPAEVRIGVVDVAIGGCDIRMFDKDKYQTYAQKDDWSGQLARQYYGGNPYQRLIDMAKIAQESGIIKGILLHQGCTNNGDPNWPTMVKKIYNDILNDLGLSADSVPIFAGETLRQDQGGSCYAHNTQVNRLPQVIPTAHAVSSLGCPGNGQDPWHFNAAGYRTMGKRYAYEVLRVMGHPTQMDSEYQMNATLRKFYNPKSFDTKFSSKANAYVTLKLMGTFEDNHREDLTQEVVFSSTDYTITNGRVRPVNSGTVTTTYADFLGIEHNLTLTIEVEGSNGIDQQYADTTPADETVYTLQGTSVGNVVDWESLPSGLYIVNRKKVQKR